ncbi:MAG: hypothetical protein ACFFBV_13985 [Promethearchaeota archaeon]
MSVIAALISKRDGVTASDGRKFSSTHLVNGMASKPLKVESDDFDKTFSLAGGKVIGAFCGLLEFGERTIAEHIQEITRDSFSSGKTFMQIVELVEQELTVRLNQVDDGEVTRLCRNVDLLLVGGVHLTRHKMRIAGVRFCAKLDGVTTTRDVVSAAKANQYYVYGEDLARIAATKTFDSNRAPNKDVSFLTKLVKDAIEVGIRNCGIREPGGLRACGGRVFTTRAKL